MEPAPRSASESAAALGRADAHPLGRADVHPEDLVDEAVALARRWASDAARIAPSGSAALLARILEDPEGLDFTLRFIDRVVRPEDLRVAAAELVRLGSTPPAFLPRWMRAAVRLGAVFAPLLPWPVVPIARVFLRRMVGHLVIDADRAAFGRAMRRIRRPGVTLNINLLGEAVLGEREALRRVEGTRRLLARDDVDYVSVKVSSVASNLNLWAFDETVERVVERLTPLYELAAAAPTPKFINLDMEEYRDLDLTIAVFTRLLSKPQFMQLRAGIVLQAYLPDAVSALDRITDFARERVAAGGSPVKVRVVKGANLAMERVDAELHGWPLATWGSKAETDANYKRVLDRALTPERLAVVGIGAAGHNVFDIALTHLLATRRGVRELVDTEMLLGMAEGLADRIREDVGGLILYTPVVPRSEFDVAISYLVRRLEENASSENFMSALYRLNPPRLAESASRHAVFGPETDAKSASGGLFGREEARFRESVRILAADTRDARGLGPVPPARRVQRRATDAVEPLGAGEFENAPDTDTAIAANREWGRAILDRARTSSIGAESIGAESIGAATVVAARIDDDAQVDALLTTAVEVAQAWRAEPAARRAEVLRSIGASLARHRADLIEVMVSDAVKTIGEADVEVSEAVDFANWTAIGAAETERMPGARFEPVAVTVVVPPWNFPVAIPAGGVLAALAAGSAAVLKPAPQVRRCGGVLADAIREGIVDAGADPRILTLVDLDEGPVGQALITDDRVGRVVLTGSIETARLFRSWKPTLPLIAETSGKDAIVVTPSADLDLAVADLVRSAFGHQGQKCSAASLGILVGSVARSERFERQLIDAAASLAVGEQWQAATQFGPLIGPATGKLLDALTTLQPGERWLLQPRRLDDSGQRWTPGIKTGVRPGSPFHVTEVFGPVLGLMPARDLDEAVALQNGTPYGLTAGLHSLDVDEQAQWMDAVEAGNLYINRGITGAIVRRQPFGGWKQSAVGSISKPGGPDYVFEFGTWVAHADASWDADLSQAQRFAKAASLFAPSDPSRLEREVNVLRYRRLAVDVRLTGDEDAQQVRREFAALRESVARDATATPGTEAAPGTAVTVSVPPGWGSAHPEFVSSVPRTVTLVEQTERAWIDGLRGETTRRIRVLDPALATRLAEATGGDPRLTIVAGPPHPSFRIGLLPYLREQTVSVTAHRFGNPTQIAAVR